MYLPDGRKGDWLLLLWLNWNTAFDGSLWTFIFDPFLLRFRQFLFLFFFFFFFHFPSFHPRVAPHHHTHCISSRLRFLCADDADTRPVQPRHAITGSFYHAVDQTRISMALTDLD
ncbi:hypothetical protein QBC45DRAFT_41199 [Copromyces sp. CBS 386.78]|nr:hypothetical protein QBC45DRAFT_41199 [Copromyces sp. CBS 386.78]